MDTLLYLEVAIRWQSLQGKDLSVRRCPQARLRAEEQLEAVVGIGVDVSACYLVHVLKIYFPLQKYNKFFIFTLPQYYLHLHLSCLTRYRLGNYNGGGYFWPPSVMLGLARHVDREDTYDDSLPGADEDDFVFLDVPLLFQYHTNNNGWGNLMVGIGPVISHCIDNDYYQVESDAYNGLNHKKKIKEYNFSLMPCIAYETRYFSLGVDASIGLRDIKRTHRIISGSKYIHNVCFTVAAKF